MVWWLVSLRSTGPVVTVTNEGINVPGSLPSASAGLPSQAESIVKEPDLEASLKAIAATFAERFGSYSNQGNFSNLDDLRDLMTVKMKAWVENFKLTQKTEAGDNVVYSGLTTKALSVKIVSFEESLGRAEVMVSTQKQESIGNTINPRVFYQDLKLQLVKTNEGWKVDSAEWQ